MSKYYKAEDVINLLATEYYTYKQAEIIEVEDCKAASEFNTKHLPTIDIVRCQDCKYWVYHFNGCSRNPCTEPWYATDFCNYGERKEE